MGTPIDLSERSHPRRVSPVCVRLVAALAAGMALSGCVGGAGPSIDQPAPSQVGPAATPGSTSSPSARPTASPGATADPVHPQASALSPDLAAALPSQLLGIPFEVMGVDAEATVGDIYDPAVGRRITGHFHRPLEDLELALARGREDEDRRGMVGFQILAIRLPEAPIAQVVGAYVAELASRPGRSVSVFDVPLNRERSRDAFALGVEPSSAAVWTDDTMYFLSYDPVRIQEMFEASPRETPAVDIAELQLAAFSQLDIPEGVRRGFPETITSRPSVPPDPELEALLPAEVGGRPMTAHGSMSTLKDGVDQLTWPAGIIAQQLGRSTADASAALAAPSDGQWPVVVIRFKGLNGEEMEAILLAEWFAHLGIGDTFTGAEVEGQRFTSNGGWAFFGRGDVLYWVSIYYGASAGPDIPGYTEDVIRALP